MSDFDLTDLGKRIKSRSAASLGIVIDELNEWKKVLLQFNSLRNNVEAGSFNVSKYADTSSKVKVGSKTTDKDDQTLVEKNTIDNTDILNKVKSLSEQIKIEFASVRSKIEEVFDFSTVNPNLENIKSIVAKIEEISQNDVEDYRTKLENKLRDMLSDNRIVFDESRILTECAIFADKVAIDEELVRLRSHFDGFADILSSGEPAGRKLDFLVQEMNRETNTIGSKCQNSSIARMVVDIKCEIEKIREQIQNIE
jgi:uncharacterized protein (TIGR00255 family)